MKALDAVIIGKTLGGKSTEAGKLRRFGSGSKTVDGMSAPFGEPGMNRRHPTGVKSPRPHRGIF
ncbi:hypothetical protein QRQ56_15585 [Bradyrhizobium sp. U531]|uniref:hypothetical protein n=1 Tax=Bradyrhizobium sp. U531 TaxID=3053458 RepID=UPI003F42D896